MESFDLMEYLSGGITSLVKNALRLSLKNPAAASFLTKYAVSAGKAEKRRRQLENNGEHIPAFLIAEITQTCNLHCAGCYARAGHGNNPQLSAPQWEQIFTEARGMGVAMILLSGGEPLTRRDVIEEAARHPQILFPLFTNGTMLDEEYISLFDKKRNLIPMLSIEGGAAQTDARRGGGIYAQTIEVMRKLCEKGILFGASITVTNENLITVTEAAFTENLREKGCKAVIFVEYVPVEQRELALGADGRKRLEQRVRHLRESEKDLILISFPGDEKYSGGCLAAGRGFFYIKADGGAAPCPFSPYSDTSVLDISLRGALRSPLFEKLRAGGILEEAHIGGCLLFERENDVKELLKAR
jgi:MoaA/NifB/PqqE/SkfB family radical SAM enzyme